MGKRGVVLLISLIVIVIIMVLIGVYFSSLLTENKSAEGEKAYLQALSLAEGGAGHLFVDLRRRIQGDLDLQDRPLGLKGRIRNNSPVFNFNSYRNNPLLLLHDYAYAYNDTTQFDNGILAVAPLDLGTLMFAGQYTNPDNDGSNPVITITSAKSPEDKSQGGMLRYEFYYNYSIKVRGKVLSLDLAKNIVTKTIRLFGSFQITIYRPTFARFALFTNHHRMPSGTTVWFTANTNFTGPVHSNERFSFANNPSAYFTEEVTQHETKARFYNNNHPILLDADSNPPRDVPNFQAGFTRGAPLINLPSSVTQQDLKTQATGGQNDGPWSSGIYLPKDSGDNLVGGIYVKGNSSNLTMSVDGSSRPVYTITQGTNTKKITIDYTNNQTIVANIAGTGGTPPGIYNGIPDGINNDGIVVYGNGSISNFSGTVQSDTKVTVSSDSDIVINDNILYESYNAGPPPNATGYTNLLGILTWNGDVRISTTAPDNINIHGVVMAAGRTGIFTVDNYDDYGRGPRGTATLLGGVITDFYGPFGTFSGSQERSGYGRNFIYDARMLQGLTPPYFPYLPGLESSDTGLNDRPIWQDKGI